ncbi:MAG: tetratricopeptide repeat protein [Candidatus Omnitrophota bacterium]
MKERSRHLPLFLLLIAAACVYFSSLHTGFMWDDFHLVVKESSIKSFRNIPLLFRQHLYQAAGGSNFFRPVQMLSLMVDYSFWKFNPVGYHLTNLLLHLMNTALVFFFVRHLCRDERVGLLTALLFAVHPVNVEAVTYIAGRADPLSTFFILAGFLTFTRFRSSGKKKFLAWSLVCFALALLSKESAVIFPFLLVLYDSVVCRQRKASRAVVAPYLGFLAIIAFYAGYRLLVMGLPLGLGPHPPALPFLLTTPKIVALYAGLLLFPLSLHMERTVSIIRSPFGAQGVISLITLAALAIVAARSYKRSVKLFFFLGFFFIGLLPVLNILSINAMMAEHWLYLPGIGAFAIAAHLFFRLQEAGSRTRALRVAAIISMIAMVSAIVFFSGRTVVRNLEWGRPLAFYRNLVRECPDSGRAHHNLGNLYLESSNYDAARREYEAAIRCLPDNPFPRHALGVLYFLTDKKKLAAEEWRTALSLEPFYQESRKRMLIYLRAEDRRFCALTKALCAHPGNTIVNYRLASIYIINGLYFEALDRLEAVLATDPLHRRALFNRAWIHSKLGLFEKAIAEYTKLTTLTPDDPDLYENLGCCYFALHNPAAAERMWGKARALRKD